MSVWRDPATSGRGGRSRARPAARSLLTTKLRASRAVSFFFFFVGFASELLLVLVAIVVVLARRGGLGAVEDAGALFSLLPAGLYTSSGRAQRKRAEEKNENERAPT